jgi:hypothetical protein
VSDQIVSIAAVQILVHAEIKGITPERVQTALIAHAGQRVRGITKYGNRQSMVHRRKSNRTVDQHHAAGVVRQRRQMLVMNVVQTTLHTIALS